MKILILAAVALSLALTSTTHAQGVPAPVRWELVSAGSIPAPRATRSEFCQCGPGCQCDPCTCAPAVVIPPIRRAVVVAAPTYSPTYPQYMAPMPAFRPHQPAPVYYGGGYGGGSPFGGGGAFMGHGGGFGSCGPGGCR